MSRAGRPALHEAEMRVEALLDVATAVFLEQGYSGASTSEIAKRAGASKQTLYSRYPTKAALFEALIERRTEVWFAKITAAMTADKSAHGPLVAFCKHWVMALLNPETQRMYQVITAEAATFPELAEMYWTNGPGRARSMLKDLLRAQMSRFTFDNLDWATEQLLGSLTGSLLVRLTLRIPSFLMSEEEVEMWVRSVLTDFLRGHRKGSQSFRTGSRRLLR
jgi:TetR/AcrR family transcriptional repressor of mexJK operon